MHVIKKVGIPDHSNSSFNPRQSIQVTAICSHQDSSFKTPIKERRHTTVEPGPDTRQFAKAYQAFYDVDKLDSKGMSRAQGIKNGSEAVPSTGQFIRAYQNFYDVPQMDAAAEQRAREIKYTFAKPGAVNIRSSRSTVIAPGIKDDPKFQVNARRFHGVATDEGQNMYMNYRAFYGAATPAVNKSLQMSATSQEQQRNLMRNKLVANARRILNAKGENFFADRDADRFMAERRRSPTQGEVLKEAGFKAQGVKLVSQALEGPNYQTFETTGNAAFGYQRNSKIDKVTKTDPPLKNLGQKRYNIVTGSIQDWY